MAHGVVYISGTFNGFPCRVEEVFGIFIVRFQDALLRVMYATFTTGRPVWHERGFGHRSYVCFSVLGAISDLFAHRQS